MIKTLKTYQGNTIALQIIGGVQPEDIDEFSRQFDDKLAKGYSHVNILMALDELSVRHSSVIAVLQERAWGVQNFHKMRHIAIIGKKANSGIMHKGANASIISPIRWLKDNWLKMAIAVEAMFIETFNSNANERYFDITELNEALEFVQPNQIIDN